MKITLNCSKSDYYCYNSPGPLSKYGGCRYHYHVQVTSLGLFSLESSNDLRIVMILSPSGRVICNKSYKEDKNFRWKAVETGRYLFKIWHYWNTDKLYSITFSGEGVRNAEQQIWSGAVSNKDGALYDKGVDVKRKNGVFKFAPQTRRDRTKKSKR